LQSGVVGKSIFEQPIIETYVEGVRTDIGYVDLRCHPQLHAYNIKLYKRLAENTYKFTSL
jgi:hypothetical protein